MLGLCSKSLPFLSKFSFDFLFEFFFCSFGFNLNVFSFRFVSLFSQGLLRRYYSLLQDTHSLHNRLVHVLRILVGVRIFHTISRRFATFLITLISASTVAGAVAVAVTVNVTADGSIEKREKKYFS